MASNLGAKASNLGGMASNLKEQPFYSDRAKLSRGTSLVLRNHALTRQRCSCSKELNLLKSFLNQKKQLREMERERGERKTE